MNKTNTNSRKKKSISFRELTFHSHDNNENDFDSNWVFVLTSNVDMSGLWAMNSVKNNIS